MAGRESPFLSNIVYFVDMDCARHALLTPGRMDIIQIIYLRLYCTFPLRVQIWIHYYYNYEGYYGNLNMSVTW